MTFTQLVGYILYAALVIVIGRISYEVYRFINDFPAEARPKILKKQYTDLYADLGAAIDETTSAKELNNALENIVYPPEMLLVAIQKKNASNDDHQAASDSAIINRFKPWIENGSNHVNNIVWNGTGYGQINDQHYFILRHMLNKYGYEYVEIKLARAIPDLALAQQH